MNAAAHATERTVRTTAKTTVGRLAGATAIVAVLAATAGCGDAEPGESEFRVETLNGVEHSVASDVPERGEAGLESLWTAPGDAEVLEGTEWANPTAVAVGEDLVAVLDPQLSRVHLFGPDGQRLPSFGRAGEGPGELASPRQLMVHGDSILILRNFTSLQWFAPDGRPLGSLPQPDGPVLSAYLLPAAGIVRPSFGGTPGNMGEQWEFLGWNGEEHPLDLPGPHPLQPHVQEGDEEGCWRRGVAGAHLVELDCTFPLVRLIDPQGRVVREHRIDRAPVRTPAEVLEEAVSGVAGSIRFSGDVEVPADMMNQIVEQQAERIRREYRWLPVMRSVQGSPSGHRIVIWEQLTETYGGGEAVLHILDGEGRYLIRHHHHGRLAGFALSDELLVALNEDPETGLRQLEAFALP